MDEKYKKILMNKFIEFVHADRQNSQLFYSLHINKKETLRTNMARSNKTGWWEEFDQMRENEKFTECELFLLRNCLLQSISSNHKYAQEDLQNSLNNISDLSFSSSEEILENLRNIIKDTNYAIDHIEKLNKLLEKFN